MRALAMAVLRLFGVRPEPRTWPTYRCPHCGHVRELGPPGQTALDGYLSGASVEWFEQAQARELERQP